MNTLPILTELMTVPFLSNHCVLEGFEDGAAADPEAAKAFLQEKLPAFEEINVIVLKKRAADGAKIVRIPSLSKDLAELAKKEEAKKKEEVARLKMEMEKMQAAMAKLSA
jgi:proteasome assembly chaperone (PAC2) family protein